MAFDSFELDTQVGTGLQSGGGSKVGNTVYSYISPGPNFFPADGRAISKSSYPALFSTLPIAGITKVTQLGPILGGAQQMRGVIYWNGVYYLYSVNAIYTSSDLVTFANLTFPGSGTNLALALPTGFMVFCNIASAGYASYNTTGTNSWVNSTYDVTYAAYTAAYGAGIVLCANQNSGLKWNNPLINQTWTACTSNDGLMGNVSMGNGVIEYINNQFIYCDNTAKLYTSLDGKAFTRVVGSNNALFNRIANINGIYYGVSYNSTVVQSSLDLVSWTTVYTPPDLICYRVAFDGKNTIVFSSPQNVNQSFYVGYGPLYTKYSITPPVAFVVYATDFANDRLFIISNAAGSTVYTAPIPQVNDDRNIPFINSRVPAWIQFA